MGCISSSFAAFVPRLLVLIGWVNDPNYWTSAFASPLWLLAGFVFMPWTTFFVGLFGPGGFGGFAFIFLIMAVLLDLGTWGFGIFANRERVSNFR